MNSSFLKNFSFSIFGESHSEYIGAVIDNLPPGLELNLDEIKLNLDKRNPNTKYNTKRKDDNLIIIDSGYNNNKTTGTPFVFRLKNNNIKKTDYTNYDFRLNHSDYVSFLKYGDNYPYSGGGPFSGRITAIYVVIGTICKQIMEKKDINIKIYSQIKKIKNITSKPLNEYSNEQLEKIQENDLKIIDSEKYDDFIAIMEEAKKNNDSLGAEIEFRIKGTPEILGDLYFESFESILSHFIFGVPGIKGITFGNSDDYFLKTGKEQQEEFTIIDNRINCKTDYSGGINGGFTNGYQDIYFQCICKAPTPHNTKLNLLNYNEGKYKLIEKEFKGRHDFIIANKSIQVIEAIYYIVIYNFIIGTKKEI